MLCKAWSSSAASIKHFFPQIDCNALTWPPGKGYPEERYRSIIWRVDAALPDGIEPCRCSYPPVPAPVGVMVVLADLYLAKPKSNSTVTGSGWSLWICLFLIFELWLTETVVTGLIDAQQSRDQIAFKIPQATTQYSKYFHAKAVRNLELTGMFRKLFSCLR